jgi:hypothetical protein
VWWEYNDECGLASAEVFLKVPDDRGSGMYIKVPVMDVELLEPK